MKKLSLVAWLVVLSACKGQQTDGEAIHARVVLDTAVSATCVLFEVRDPASHGVLSQKWLPRTSNALQIAIFRGTLPTDVELAARPYRDGDCQGGAEAQTANGVYVTGSASFVTGQITQANPLTLQPGQDADGDGYVSTASGGSDCDDSSSGAQIHPGVTETCSDQGDLNCDGKRGCEATTCSANMCIGPPATLALTLPTTPVPAGPCTQGAVLVEDAHGAPTQASVPLSVGLAAAPSAGLAFYANAACTTPVSSVTIGMHEGAASFYFQGRAAGNVTVSASSSGLATATQNVQIIPGAGNQLVFLSSSQTLTAGGCSQLVQVQSQDAVGNAAPVAVATPISLSADPATNLKFYSDASCTSQIATANLATSESTVGFYFKDPKAESVTLTVNASSFTGSSQLATIQAGPPTVVALSGPLSVAAGNCSSLPVTVQLRDSLGNPASATSDTTITLTSTGQPLMFSTSNSCAPTVTSLSILTGASMAIFYFTGAQAGGSTINAAASGMTAGTLPVTVSAGPATQLVFTTGVQMVTVGNCSAVTTVQLRDANNNPAPVSSDTPVTLVASPPDGFQFFTDSSCMGTAVTMVNMPNSSSNASFYFKGTRSGTVGVNATVSAISQTQNETLNPLMPTKLAFTTSPLTIAAGDCAGPVTVQARDSLDNASPVSTNTTLTLNQAGTPTDPQFKFYTDSSCMTLTPTSTSLTLPSGQSTVSFYYRGEIARSVGLAVSETALGDSGVQSHTITPASTARVHFSSSTPEQILLAGTCAKRTVERQDAFGNARTDTTDLSVGLSGSTTTEFFSDPGCTNLVSQVTILAAATSADFYFKGYTGGVNATAPLTLTASPSGFSAGTQVETIIPTVRSGLCTMTGASINCSIVPALSNMAQAFLVFRASSTNTGSDKGNVRCHISSVSQVTCSRNSGAGSADVTIQWNVAEFPTTVAVQHLSPACVADTTDVSLSNVTTNESFLLLSSERGGPNQDSSVPRLAELTSNSQVQIRKTGGCGGGDTNDLQVVDYPGASVQRGLASVNNGTASSQVPLLTTVVPDRSILLYSYVTDGTGANVCNRTVRGEITGAGSTITFSRGAGDTTNCLGAQINSISWEVVQFPPGTVVQQITQSTTATSLPISLAQSVDLSRTLIIAGGQWASGQVQGEAQHTSTDAIGEMRAQAFLSDNSTVLLSRAAGSGTAIFTFYVVQLKP